jgi:hypothetical protein
MAIANFLFSETSPSTAGTFFSSQPVQNSANYLPAGVCGPVDDFLALNVAAVLRGGTSDTLDVYLQLSPDDGATWFDCLHFPQLSAGQGATTWGCALGVEADAIVAIGSGNTPALAANTIAFGGWGSRLRMAFVAGASTSGGAPQKVWIFAQRPEYGRRY